MSQIEDNNTGIIDFKENARLTGSKSHTTKEIQMWYKYIWYCWIENFTIYLKFTSPLKPMALEMGQTNSRS